MQSPVSSSVLCILARDGQRKSVCSTGGDDLAARHRVRDSELPEERRTREVYASLTGTTLFDTLSETQCMAMATLVAEVAVVNACSRKLERRQYCDRV